MSVLKYKDPETGEVKKVGMPKLDTYTKDEIDKIIADSVKNSNQIASGSYIGDGKYGIDNPNSLTFDFEPKIVIIQCADSSLKKYLLAINGVNSSGPFDESASSSYKDIFNWDGNTFSWYHTGSNNPAFMQYNEEGAAYHYFAIGDTIIGEEGNQGEIDISKITPEDIGAVPATRTVNGKALNDNIELNAADVGALPSRTEIPSIEGLATETFVTESIEAAHSSILDYVEPIGTIKTTMRSDLTENWLLCDGSEVEIGTYPELDSMLEDYPNIKFYDKEFSIESEHDIHVVNVFYENNTPIVVYYIDHTGTISDRTYHIAFRDENSSLWETSDLPVSVGILDKIRWLKDRYVLILQKCYVMASNSYCYHSTDLKIWNAFSPRCINFDGNDVYLRDIVYGSGNYILHAERNVSGSTITQWVGFSNTLEGPYDCGGNNYGSRSYSSTAIVHFKISYANGLFFATYSKSNEVHYLWFVDAASPTHEVMRSQQMTIDTSSDKIGGPGCSNVVYLNGKYYIARSSRLYSFVPSVNGDFSLVISRPDAYAGFSMNDIVVDQTSENILCVYMNLSTAHVGIISNLQTSPEMLVSNRYLGQSLVKDLPTGMSAGGTHNYILSSAIMGGNILACGFDATMKEDDGVNRVQFYRLDIYKFKGYYSKLLPSVTNGSIKTYVKAY